MRKRNNLIKLIQLWGIIFLIGVGVSIVAVDVIGSYRAFHSHADQMRADNIVRQKQIIKQEVNRVVDMIIYEKAQSEMLVKKKIKSRVYEAYAIAQNIYQQNKTAQNASEIQNRILDALRPIRFESGSGYFFATRLDGVEILFADKPAMERLNLLNMKDTRGQYVIKDMIQIAKQSGEGFYEYHWTKPHSKGNDFKKISFIKRFKPYDWFIGTGLYVDDVEQQIKAKLLSAISRIRFGKEGYIFVNRLNGDALVSNGKLFSGTKKLWEVFDKNPEKMKAIFDKEYSAALKPEGDYIYYSHIKLTNPDKESPKASFIYGIPDLQWLVGAGVYIDDVETDIALIQSRLNHLIKTKIFYFILTVMGMFVFFLLFFNWLNRGLKNDFNLFISFFKRAAHSDEEIDRETIKFVELDQMAEYANKMLTDRKKTEAALRNSEEKYRYLVESANSIILRRDVEGNVTFFNEFAQNFFGYTEKEILGRSALETIVPETESTGRDLRAMIADIGRNPDRYTANENENMCRNGRRVWIAWTNKPIYDETGAVIEILCVGNDVTDRKRAEEAVREAYNIINRSPAVAFLWKNIEGWPVEFVSNNVNAIFGYNAKEFISGKITYAQVVHPDDLERVEKEITIFSREKGREEFTHDPYRIITKDGKVKWLDDMTFMRRDTEGDITHFQGIVLDISERVKAEDEKENLQVKLQRSQKMESLGLLAGGVAHDLNNVLSGIVSYPELLLLDLPKNSKLRKPIETMQESGHRAAAIVQDLLTVARGVATIKEPLNLNNMVGDYLNSPEFKKLKQFHPKIAINTNLDSNLLNILGSHVHIRKVVMNLVSNASEAIEGSGNVTMSTMNRYIDRPLKGYDDVTTGEYAVLAVSDDGTGISSVELERIFEPFYTKKIMGRSGTGLGLAVVWNVIQDHEGYIDVKSDQNGTTFELYFPITRKEIDDKVLSVPVKDYKGNGETILVVDDVESQREIACKMLDTLGYEAIAVSSGEEAVAYLKEHSVELIVLDMILDPGISGCEAYERIIKIHPKQKAIIASGFAETDDVKEAQKLGAGQYLKKPLTLEKLGIAVRDELRK